MKIGFKVKYGYNEIDIPVTEETRPKYRSLGRKDRYVEKVTIYNDVASDGVNPRRFDRFVISKCLIYNDLGENADRTIGQPIEVQNVITRDVEHYKTPLEYAQLPADLKENYYTVKPNDFVILAEVDDIVTTSREFQDLQSKYKDNGFSVTAVSAYLNGTNTNNIHIQHA